MTLPLQFIANLRNLSSHQLPKHAGSLEQELQNPSAAAKMKAYAAQAAEGWQKRRELEEKLQAANLGRDVWFGDVNVMWGSFFPDAHGLRVTV